MNDFYSAAAQVIPILVLALTIDLRGLFGSPGGSPVDGGPERWSKWLLIWSLCRKPQRREA
ncbi:hypothetical protein [Geodermatophilus sp. SYSU D00700]